METIVLLGASGSIGSQTLSILKKNPKDFCLLGFSVGKQTRKIKGIISHFPSVKAICISDTKKVKYYQDQYPNIKVFSSSQGLIDLIEYSKPSMVVNALVGFVGLKPSLFTLEHDIDLALANKEALVVGGELVNKLLKEGHGHLYPIDSEHSAIWKCLLSDNKNVEKLLITASGGAFRKLSREELKNVTAKDALNHPTWKMGAKITIDCATMVNKAFEIIEAYQLFKYKTEKIEVILHDESYVHSMVKYGFGIYKADVNKPDMRNPIKFALYKGNIPYTLYSSDDYLKFGQFHFHQFDINRYPLVKYAKVVIDEQGNRGCVFNASNEVAVHAFLKGQIPFLAIESLIEQAMNHFKNKKHPTYDDLLMKDLEVRAYTERLIYRRKY